MSVACQQHYVISVTIPKFYWTLDEPNPSDDRVDKFQSLHLGVTTVPGFNPPTVDNNGLFVNGVEWNHPAPASSQLLSGGANVGAPVANFAYTRGQGFSIWMWVKPNNIGAPGGPLIILPELSIFDDAIGTNTLCHMIWTLNRTQVLGRMFDFTNNDQIIDPNAVNITPGHWTLLQWKYDASVGFFSIRQNLNAWTTSAVLLDVHTGGFGNLVFGTTGGGNNEDWTVDETGLVYEVLTDAQWTQIFNGGVGVTWPTISTIV